jgi:hypothetical protein
LGKGLSYFCLSWTVPQSYRLWCVFECDQVKINNLDTYCE